MQSERRRYERRRTMGKVTLAAGGVELSGELFDVSKRGIGLVLEQAPAVEISPGTQWLCHVDSDDFPTTLTFLARVVRQQKLENGILLGCELCL